MLIDWFTVVAQGINFLILIWLLKRFLYSPILEAVEAREKEIADQTAQAALLKIEANKSMDEFQSKNKVLQDNSAKLLSTAKTEAGELRTRLLDEAQKDAEILKVKYRETFDKEREDLSHEIGEQLQQQVFAVARKMLLDIASTGLEEQIVQAFTNRLVQMKAKEKELFSVAILSSNHPLIIRSAFALSSLQQEALQKIIESTSAAKLVIQYETTAELISGIEFITDNYKLCWSIGDYLSSLEKKAAAVSATIQQ